MRLNTRTNHPPVKIAVIGGSGLYEIDGLHVTKTFFPTTPFGKPSDPITIGEFQGVYCAFLPRHGKGHRLLPSEIPHKANIFALKQLGVEFVVAVSACGSLKEELAPRHFVVPDQIIDRTKGRESTFFGNGIVAHVSFATPFSQTLSFALADSVRRLHLPVWDKGTYLCMEGPAFSTRAESQWHRQMNCDVIGMTAIPEAKLAREAEISYALLAMVTDYDCWKDNDEVSVDMVLGHLMANVEQAKKIIATVLPQIHKIDNDAAHALRHAIFTKPEHIPSSIKRKLKPLIGKYIS